MHRDRKGQDPPRSLDAEHTQASVAAKLFGEAAAPLRLGRFELGRRLGRGSSGVVYEAYDTQLQQRVALKCLSALDARGIYRLKREFRALADLAHPNLVSLYELFAEGEQWFFSMQLIDGTPFDTWVRPGDVLDQARLLRALSDLADAVDVLHRHGKLHRDLKPSNVLVDPSGHLTVLDFDLVAELSATDSQLEPVGTPAYMAPEQAAGQPATQASDWYAVGVMLFEADGQAALRRLLACSAAGQAAARASPTRQPAPPARCAVPAAAGA